MTVLDHNSVRTWGNPPYKVAVVHGGPGAAGAAAPIARELSRHMGLLEPWQTRATLDGQIQELAEVLQEYTESPAVLLGHSWGAWLVFLTAATYPSLVKKLILVGCGPFLEKDALNIFTERVKRLTDEERIELFKLIGIINGVEQGDKDKAMGRYGELSAKADTYESFAEDEEPLAVKTSEEINRRVWDEAHALRINGELVAAAEKIRCPVTAIHGDYDPHPAAGVREPLSRTLKNFRFILLEKCGHEPWIERYARDDFFRILREEISST